MLKDRSHHQVRFFVQHGVNVISGNGWFTGYVCFDNKGQEHCKIQYAAPGLCAPVQRDKTEDYIYLWVPICNITELDEMEESAVETDGTVNLFIGNNSSYKCKICDWFRTLQWLCSSTLEREKANKFRVHVSIPHSNPNYRDEGKRYLIGALQEIFGDDWVGKHTHREKEKVIIYMDRSDLKEVLKNERVIFAVSK